MMMTTITTISTTAIIVLTIVLVIAFSIDSNIGYIADFIPDFVSSTEGIALFIVLAVVFAVAGIIIITSSINRRTVLIIILQAVLIALIALVIVHMLSSAQYYVITIGAVLAISYGMWIVVLGLLAKSFISWLRSSTAATNKRNIMVLILTLSMIAYVVNGASLLTAYLAQLQEQQKEIVTSEDIAFFSEFDVESFYHQVNLVGQISAIVAYVLTWIGTVLLLQSYIKRLGKIKFYAIMGAAMLYYVVAYPLFVLGYLTPIEDETDVDIIMNNILLVGVGTVLSGIIFGVAFISVARTLQKGIALRRHMIIAACGFILFYVAGDASVAQLAYAPYGLVSTAFVGIACYLIYVGLYSAVIAVSQDFQLRDYIRNSAKHSKFLEVMGTAEMEQEKQKLVTTVSKQSEAMQEETGVEASMTEEDISAYMDDVLKEIEVMKKKDVS